VDDGRAPESQTRDCIVTLSDERDICLSLSTSTTAVDDLKLKVL
jgi:hypothetical protein